MEGTPLPKQHKYSKGSPHRLFSFTNSTSKVCQKDSNDAHDINFHPICKQLWKVISISGLGKVKDKKKYSSFLP